MQAQPQDAHDIVKLLASIAGVIVLVNGVVAGVIKLFVSSEIKTAFANVRDEFGRSIATVKTEINQSMILRDERAERRTETLVTKLDQQTDHFNERFRDIGREFIRREQADTVTEDLRRRVQELEALVRGRRKDD